MCPESLSSVEEGKDVCSALLTLKIASAFSKPVQEIFIIEESDWK
jgi:DNA-binding XRE family transcriptional regulator